MVHIAVLIAHADVRKTEFMQTGLISSFLIACLFFGFSAGAETVRFDDSDFILVGDQMIDMDLFQQSQMHVQGAKPAKVRLWPDGVIGIKFTKEVGPELQRTVWAACKEWSAAAKVRCQKGPYKGISLTIGRSYFGVGNGCWSMLGSDVYFMGIRRRMNLGKGCERYSTVLHELGHAFGLTHEHQRMDRDQYVDILEENVDKQFANFGLKLNFEKQNGDLLTDYDFLSIMHYSSRAFSKNGKDTIRPKKEFLRFSDIMGRGTHLSEGDVMSIQALYGAPEL